MQNVVPWVPYLWRRQVTLVSPSVTHYVYDQNANLISWSHTAVDNGVSAASL